MQGIERVEAGGQLLACIVRRSFEAPATTFVTPEHTTFQLGFIVYPAAAEIRRHAHRPLQRSIVGTPEMLMVQRGRCEVDIYGTDGRMIATKTLEEGDILLLLAGGHGLRLLDDTVLLEVKQGPYVADEKELF